MLDEVGAVLERLAPENRAFLREMEEWWQQRFVPDDGELDLERQREAPERLTPVLGEQETPSAILTGIGAALAAVLECADAAIIEWLPGNEGFEVRAAVGAPRDWLSFQDAGPQAITCPIRIAGQSVGLFAGLPGADWQPTTGEALLALAGVAIAWSRKG